MSSFVKGDLVRLKSGGPDMTVANVGSYRPLGPEDGALCQWFDGAKRSEEVFDCATLEKVERKPLNRHRD